MRRKCPFKRIPFFNTCDIYKHDDCKCELALTLTTNKGEVTRCALWWTAMDLADFKFKLTSVPSLLEEIRNNTSK